METLKKILRVILKLLNIFFVFLGVVFTILIIAGIHFYITDPLELRPMVEPLFFGDTNFSESLNGGQNPYMTGQQEQILNNIGINLEDLPSQITPDMERCFIEKLGAERIKEFGAGKMPAITDILKIKPCLSTQ